MTVEAYISTLDPEGYKSIVAKLRAKGHSESVSRAVARAAAPRKEFLVLPKFYAADSMSAGD